MKTRNVTWGIFFIIMAVFIILGGLDLFGDFNVWTAIGTGFCAIWFINGLVKFSFGNMLFPLAFLAILFDEALGIEDMTPFPVLFAALFGTIGLNMIFGSRKKHKVEVNGTCYNWDDYNKVVQETTISDERFDCEVAFGSSVKYVNSMNLKVANIETSFGSSTIYFDNAKLCDGKATINVETSFGKTILYVPKEWAVHVNVSKAFAGVTEKGKCQPNSNISLMIVGEVSFGNMEIIYV